MDLNVGSEAKREASPTSLQACTSEQRMLGSSDESGGSSPQGNSPQSSPPPPDPLDPGGAGAESVAEMCKASLDQDSLIEQELAWWDTWVKRWNEDFVPSFRIRDDDAKIEEARRVRKMCKDAKTPKDQTAQQVQEALAQLPFVVPPCPPPNLPAIEDDFPKAQLALCEQRASEAGRRIDAIKHSIERDEKAEDDVAISKAMLGKCSRLHCNNSRQRPIHARAALICRVRSGRQAQGYGQEA